MVVLIGAARPYLGPPRWRMRHCGASAVTALVLSLPKGSENVAQQNAQQTEAKARHRRHETAGEARGRWLGFSPRWDQTGGGAHPSTTA